ncbi:MAG: TonB-dependent receptor [Marinoscillum sp.]|uniref:TonB-dependent receptor n=1 Tax=Marinoscillum sp. TaxID=2024838 RepID=UPI0032F2EAB3
MRKILLLTLAVISYTSWAQVSISGKVTDDAGQEVVGATVLEKGTSNGVITDYEGKFSLQVSSPNAVLTFSFVGFKSQEVAVAGQTNLSVTLREGLELGAVTVVGSRNENRTELSTPVPVDVIDLAEIPSRNGQIEINQILQYAAPSFNSSKQSGSDGADHIDPATLRGLGPDQTLVLINGKRRHQSSLINVFGTRGRGNTGTDLNAIPVASIKRIEILRDGASAQYGSDAIAGVINIVLKDNTGDISGNVTYGAYSTAADGSFDPGTANVDGKNRLYDDDRSFDGNTVRASLNYGLDIGDDGGFVNFTTEFVNKEKVLRPGASFRQGYGEAGIQGFNFMVNASVPVGDKTEFYAFGGRNFRNTDAYAFSRDAESGRNVLSIYPNGFTPRITSIISDASVSTGFKQILPNGWKMDVNNSFGKNDFHYYIKNTVNASLEEASPTDFDAGGHSLAMNVTSATLTKYYDGFLAGTNLAFGMEYRTETFGIFSGEEGSYATYDTLGLAITRPDQQAPEYDGEPRPGGSQGFPGYSPANEVLRSRSNLALYVDTEVNLTEQFLIGAALRYENYSDFGETFNYKLASRFELTDNLALRGSVSSGFRAPSLAQIYYNLRFTNFIGGEALEVLLAPNNSPVTRGFGIEQLKQETANNASLGVTLEAGNFTATVDGYYITVQDRIVLTDYFDASSLNINVVDAQFFANGLDTKTTGLDMVLNYRAQLGANRLSVALTGNINDISIEKINNGNLDADVFFGPREQYFLKASAPPSKFGLNIGYFTDRFDVSLAFTRFSEITVLDWQIYEDDADYGGYQNKLNASKDVYEAGVVTDLSISFQVTDGMTFSLGGNNIFNVYPSQQDDWTDSGGYWDSVQMGVGGAYFFGRIGFNF